MGHTVIPKLGISSQKTPSEPWRIPARPPRFSEKAPKASHRSQTHPLHSSFVTFAWQNFSIPASGIGGLGCRRRLAACDVPCVLTLGRWASQRGLYRSRSLAELISAPAELGVSATLRFRRISGMCSLALRNVFNYPLVEMRDSTMYGSVVHWYSQS